MSEAPRVRFWILALTAALWANTLLFGFIWDDAQLIVDRPLGDASLWQVARAPFFPPDPEVATTYYRPIPKLALELVYRAVGPTPWLFHALNIALHLCCVGLCCVWLARRMGSVACARTSGVAALAIATLLFALHPSRPQCVTWVSGATELWPTLFLLLGALAWQRRHEHVRFVAASAACCMLAYLSKETAIAFPLLLAADAWLLAPTRGQRHALPKQVAWLVGGVLVGHLARATVIATPWSRITERGLWSLATRGLLSFGYAVKATFAPLDPRFQLNVAFDRIEGLDKTLLPLMMLGGLVLIASALLLLRALRTPSARPWAADAAWYVVPLLPTLNLLPIGSGITLSERYLYAPMLGCSALLVRALPRWLEAWPRRTATLCALALCGLALLCVQQNATMRDQRSLLEHFYAQAHDELWTIDALMQRRLEDGDVLGAREIALQRLNVIWNADYRADRALAASQRMRALITFARLELLITSDYDRARLLELRQLFDAIEDAQARAALLRVADKPFEVELLPQARAAAKAVSPDFHFYQDLVSAHARTLDLDGAAAIAALWVQREPHEPRAQHMLVRSLLWQQRWAEAATAIRQAQSAAPSQLWTMVEQQRAHAEHDLAASGAPDSVGAALARARFFAATGLPAAGYRALGLLPPADQAGDPALQTRVALELADKRFDLAERSVTDAVRAHPAQQERWRPTANEIISAERASPLRRHAAQEYAAQRFRPTEAE